MSSIAVIDVETTGLNPYRHDRIVEVAALVIAPNGQILKEFTSLINPERDIGPMSVHGVSAQEALQAPRFHEIAGHLCRALDGCVALAGHNIRFDVSFLTCEFKRLGYEFPVCPTLCTLQLSGGGNLRSCCLCRGIDFEGTAHSALHDARATARLLTKLMHDGEARGLSPSALPKIVWPGVPASTVSVLRREESQRNLTKIPCYLEKLLLRPHTTSLTKIHNADALAYINLLDRILEDRRVDDEEGKALFDMADRWGICATQIAQIHRDYLNRLALAAIEDEILTDAEQRDLQLVAHLLGIDNRTLNVMLVNAREAKSQQTKPLRDRENIHGRSTLCGKSVCFTGEFQCRIEGNLITREMATQLATQYGLIVVESVTKKLDLLVVADPYTQSGKAKKAHAYGIRILHEPVFWQMIGVSVE